MGYEFRMGLQTRVYFYMATGSHPIMPILRLQYPLGGVFMTPVSICPDHGGIVQHGKTRLSDLT